MKNWNEAEKMGPLEFKRAVQNRGKWDYKQRTKHLGKTDPAHRHMQRFGNWHYGFVGTAAGFSRDALHRQAGRAQIRAGTSEWKTNPSWGRPAALGGLIGGVYPFGDDPQDAHDIALGITYAEWVKCMKENGVNP